MKDFWNDRYADAQFAYGTEPNTFFAEQINTLTPGKLLLPAEGEGRNAVYAASLGWEVHAFDYSKQGQEKALALAQKNGVDIHYHIMDFATFQCDDNYDAIGLIYAHMPSELRKNVHHKLAASLNPNGRIILEAFHKNQLGRKSGGPKNEDMLYTKSDLKNDFASLNIDYLEKEKVYLDEGNFHYGEAVVVRGVFSN